MLSVRRMCLVMGDFFDPSGVSILVVGPASGGGWVCNV